MVYSLIGNIICQCYYGIMDITIVSVDLSIIGPYIDAVVVFIHLKIMDIL
mgnify:CR=1